MSPKDNKSPLVAEARALGTRNQADGAIVLLVKERRGNDMAEMRGASWGWNPSYCDKMGGVMGFLIEMVGIYYERKAVAMVDGMLEEREAGRSARRQCGEIAREMELEDFLENRVIE